MRIILLNLNCSILNVSFYNVHVLYFLSFLIYRNHINGCFYHKRDMLKISVLLLVSGKKTHHYWMQISSITTLQQLLKKMSVVENQSIQNSIATHCNKLKTEITCIVFGNNKSNIAARTKTNPKIIIGSCYIR